MLERGHDRDGKTVTTTYNDRGQRKTVTYNLGKREFYYDSMGRLTKDIKEDGQYIAYAYDAKEENEGGQVYTLDR